MEKTLLASNILISILTLFFFLLFIFLLENTVIAALWHFAFHLDDSCDLNEMESVTMGLSGLDGFVV